MVRGDDATFVLSRRPPASKETLRIATLSAAAGGAIGAFVATVGVVAFFHSRDLEASAHAAAPRPPVATGALSITTLPSARVYEGERLICAATPCPRLVLPAGPHDLVLVASDDQQRRSVRVMVAADETRELRIAFRSVNAP